MNSSQLVTQEVRLLPALCPRALRCTISQTWVTCLLTHPVWASLSRLATPCLLSNLVLGCAAGGYTQVPQLWQKVKAKVAWFCILKRQIGQIRSWELRGRGKQVCLKQRERCSSRPLKCQVSRIFVSTHTRELLCIE